LAKKPGELDVEAIIAGARPEFRRQREASARFTRQAVRAMSQEVERCRETLAHHLLDLSLVHILYFWVILRLKYRPWRVLVPVSVLSVVIYRLAAGSVPNLWTILAGGLVH